MNVTARSAISEPNPGPMVRFDEVTSDVGTMPMIVQRVAEGEPLKAIAKSLDVPYSKLSQWIVEDASRAEQYARAQRIWVDSLAVECVAIADEQEEVERGGKVFDPDVSRDKLRIDTRLKLAERLDRDRYGVRPSQMNLQVNDNRVQFVDREAALLETARGMLYVLEAAGDVREAREVAALPAVDAVVVEEQQAAPTSAAAGASEGEKEMNAPTSAANTEADPGII